MNNKKCIDYMINQYYYIYYKIKSLKTKQKANKRILKFSD